MASRSQLGKRARAKGKLFQKQLAQMVADSIDLPLSDVSSCVGGITEADVKLSREARNRFPVLVEAKNYKRWSASHMREWIAQVEAEAGHLIPAVVFKFHGEGTPYATMKFEDLLMLMKMLRDRIDDRE